MILRSGSMVPQVEVIWSGMEGSLASCWEDAQTLKIRFFRRHPVWGQTTFDEGGNVSSSAHQAGEKLEDSVASHKELDDDERREKHEGRQPRAMS